MNSPRPRLAQAVLPEITEGRVTRQWASIEQRLPRRRGVHGPAWYGTAAAVALLVVGLYYVGTRASPVPITGTVIESASTPVTVTLRDGSTLSLDAQTKLRLLRDEPQLVDVELGSGKANFDVTHVSGRTFRVHAGIVQVKVLGTRFEVAKTPRKEGTHIQVAVARGVVEVQRQDGTGGVRRLNAGETWSALITAHSFDEMSAPGRAPPPAAEATPPPAGVPPPAAHDTFLPEPVSPAQDRRSARARAAVLARERASTTAALFKRANLARRTGQVHEAADAYAELLRRYPADSRAGLVAFELGRIRMDALAQPKAAVEAFSVALRSFPRASYREDALARIVIAHEKLGARDACRIARENYLRDYPNGIHALALAARCGG